NPFGGAFSRLITLQPKKVVIDGDLEVRGRLTYTGQVVGGSTGDLEPIGNTGSGNGKGPNMELLPPGEGGGTGVWSLNGSSAYYNDGNVGIGTSSPVAKLDVRGGSIVAGYTGGQLRITGGTVDAGLWTSSDNILRVANWSSGTLGMSINLSTGNIGIGTQSPSNRLDLYQGILRVWNGTGTAPIRFYSTGDGTHNNANIDIWTKGFGGTEELYNDITNWGGSFYYRFGSGPGMWTGVRIYSNGSSSSSKGFGLLSVYNNDSEKIRFSANGLTFFNGGHVVIGSTTDQGNYSLAVNGNIKAKELYLTTSGWSDFVFEPGYSLRTLHQVQNFITKNGHLPDMPSEKEVIENGVGVIDMQAKLLQKIEELTLYLIEQGKNKEEQQKQIDALRKEIQKMRKELKK
ncbi:MAG: OmpH family outer membrane protein, partial [Bacteroidetes bacterium]|nr:OmpH family outer membrane protein [Bacteroidota bacterium]